MNDDASSSKPPPPPPLLPSELLAPGFRFHPTDEELVSYYLKRRVSGRPLRVDAIAEVELYKAEPWDLPAMSRLQSRDKEWYFFSPLDRKYANRSRTNRATVQGYWKTTGKDRAIRHGPRTVGMKKTLVFHVGRAPRGDRTNWLMHEYRLEDEELDRAGISQDAYVVCRIFQKSGSGPQNGAQYGGAFIEEEWEEADDLVPAIEGGDNAVTSSWDEEYLQLADFVHNEDQGNEPGSNGLLTASSDEQNSGSQLEDPFLLETFQDQSFVDMNANGLQDSPTIYNDIGGDIGLAVLSHSPPSQNEGYMELNDLVDAMNQGDESINLPETYEVEEFFDTANESTDEALFQVLHPTVQDDFVLEPDNLLNPMAGDNPSEQTTAEYNMVFYDAPSNDPPFAQDNFVQMNDLLYSPTADPPGFSLLDDIMVYFDSTDTDLPYSTLDYSSENLQPVDSSVLNQSNFAPEVDNSSVPSEANPGWDASSSSGLPNADDRSNNINGDIMVVPDSSKEKDCDRTVKNRLVNMLGSISAPPAFAAEFPAASGKSTSNSASSAHVTTGMIQIHGFKEMGMAEHWSLHKNRSSEHGIASDYAVDGFEPITKERGWMISAMLQDGFNLFFRTAVFVAVCFKVVMCVYSR